MKKRNLIGCICGVLLIVITAVFLFTLNKINAIPDNYFKIILIGVSIVTVITSIILFLNVNSISFKVLKILSYIVTVILIFGYSFGMIYLNKTLHFIGNIDSIKKEVTSYYVVVLKDSKYEEISDLYGKTMLYYINTDEDVLSKLKLELIYSTTKNIEQLKDKLYTKKVESILISDLIKEDLEDKYEDFSSKTRILQTIDITKEVEDITKKVSIKNTAFNVLISGMDSYGNINKTTRNDVNIVVTINPNTNKMLLTSIPRDYYVQLHGKKGYKDKLTHAGIYGINTAVQTIEDLFNIDINYYVKVNFTTVVDLVDKIGPIEIYSDKNLNLDGCKYVVGNNVVNGKCALRFARERHSYLEGDNHRVKNQQEVIKGIFNKLKNSPNILADYNSVLEVMNGKFATNIEMSELTSFIKYEVEDIGKYEIISAQVDGTGSMEYTYSYPHQKLYVMFPNEQSVSNAKEGIEKILNGE
mgnify:CR=1 FL=1